MLPLFHHVIVYLGMLNGLLLENLVVRDFIRELVTAFSYSFTSESPSSPSGVSAETCFSCSTCDCHASASAALTAIFLSRCTTARRAYCFTSSKSPCSSLVNEFNVFALSADDGHSYLEASFPIFSNGSSKSALLRAPRGSFRLFRFLQS
jgi:hypothetical protein